MTDEFERIFKIVNEMMIIIFTARNFYDLVRLETQMVIENFKYLYVTK
jgi:hypothetical protein